MLTNEVVLFSGPGPVCRLPSQRGGSGCGDHDWKVSLQHFCLRVKIQKPNRTFRTAGKQMCYLFGVCCRWLVLDTDTRDLVTMHTDGNEIISNVKYSPGKASSVHLTDTHL